jgi:hypothetical protein
MAHNPHGTQPSISILDTDDSKELQQFLIQSSGIAAGFVIWAVMEYATLLDAHARAGTTTPRCSRPNHAQTTYPALRAQPAHRLTSTVTHTAVAQVALKGPRVPTSSSS